MAKMIKSPAIENEPPIPTPTPAPTNQSDSSSIDNNKISNINKNNDDFYTKLYANARPPRYTYDNSLYYDSDDDNPWQQHPAPSVPSPSPSLPSPSSSTPAKTRNVCEEVEVQAPKRQYKDEEISVNITSSKIAESADRFVHISIQSAQGKERTPLDICCVVDVSGSMDNPVLVKGESGEMCDHGFTILDVVKHSLKTIINSLEPMDRLSIVAFESDPHMWLPLTQVTSNNIKYMDARVEAMHPMGLTDLWRGLELGLNTLLDVKKEERATHLPILFVLTDGTPDYDPIPQLKLYKQHKNSVGQHLPIINTFGFGYTLQTPVLLEIAKYGNGVHVFIPDASFIGTAFVNAISNVMVINAVNVSLSAEPRNGVLIKEVMGYEVLERPEGDRIINMCSLQYGQTKDVILRVSLPKEECAKDNEPYLRVALKYDRAIEPEWDEPVEVTSRRLNLMRDHGLEEKPTEAKTMLTAEDGGVALEVQKLRLHLANKLLEIITSENKKEIQEELEV